MIFGTSPQAIIAQSSAFQSLQKLPLPILDLMNIWTPDSSARPVPTAEIQAWEREKGLRVPAPLRDALMIHNGGTLLDSVDPVIEVRPLEEWELIDPELVELFKYEGDPRQFMAFAYSDYGSCYYLNYARCNSAGEPVVGSMNQSGLSIEESSDDVATYLAKLAGSLTEKPAVDGSHAARLTHLGQTQLVTKDATHHSLLGRDGDGHLVHLHYHTSRDEERWTATCLPGPLRRTRLLTSETGTKNQLIYQLQLCPQQTTSIREWTSTRQPGGRWKNELTEGYPGSTTVQSLELESILLLRRALTCPPQTQAQEEAENLRIDYLRLMAASTSKERAMADLHLKQMEMTKSTRSPAKSRGLAWGSGGSLMGLNANRLLGGNRGNNMMMQIMSAATTLLSERAGGVPEATMKLIERLVAAEAAAGKDDES